MITQLHGDCLALLETLDAESVQTIVTSPPYWQLRKYTDDPREIGRESTPAAYVAALVNVFRACRRVLRADGTLWINMGDGYNGHGPSSKNQNRVDGGKRRLHAQAPYSGAIRLSALQPKQLLGMPWRLAFALQDEGWILRSDIIWSKPNCMPESVTDRPTRAHEYVFLFSKSRRYYYDALAIAEATLQPAGVAKLTGQHPAIGAYKASGAPSTNGTDGSTLGTNQGAATRNARSVWTIATQPLSDEHYAAMPVALADRCIRAGSSAQACETCGAAWGRVVERTPMVVRPGPGRAGLQANSTTGSSRTTITGTMIAPATSVDLGFAPRCACAVNTGSGRSTVLDPFAGSGTTLRAAVAISRDAIGIDLAYQDMQERRTNGVQIELL